MAGSGPFANTIPTSVNYANLAQIKAQVDALNLGNPNAGTAWASVVGAESGGNPLAVNSLSGAVGLNQYLGSRETGLSNWLVNNNTDISNVSAQTAYGLSEAAGPSTYAPTWSALTNPNMSLADTQATIINNFERPGAAGAAIDMANANSIATNLSAYTGPVGTSGAITDSGGPIDSGNAPIAPQAYGTLMSSDPAYASSYTTPLSGDATLDYGGALGPGATQSMANYDTQGTSDPLAQAAQLSYTPPGNAPIDPYSTGNLSWQGEPLDNPFSSNPLTTANTDTSAYTLGTSNPTQAAGFDIPSSYNAAAPTVTTATNPYNATPGASLPDDTGTAPAAGNSGPDTTAATATATGAGDWESGGVGAVTSGFNSLTKGLSTTIQGAINATTSSATGWINTAISDIADWFLRGGLMLLAAIFIILALYFVMKGKGGSNTNITIAPVPV